MKLYSHFTCFSLFVSKFFWYCNTCGWPVDIKMFCQWSDTILGIWDRERCWNRTSLSKSQLNFFPSNYSYNYFSLSVKTIFENGTSFASVEICLRISEVVFSNPLKWNQQWITFQRQVSPAWYVISSRPVLPNESLQHWARMLWQLSEGDELANCPAESPPGVCMGTSMNGLMWSSGSWS